MIKSFCEWLELREAKQVDADTLWNYYRRFIQEADPPHIDDFKTLGNMILNNFKGDPYAILADMLPKIDEKIKEMPQDERSELIDYFGRLKIPGTHYQKAIIKRGWHPQTSLPFKLVSSEVLKNKVEEEMNEEYPDLNYINTLLTNNQDLLAELGEEWYDYVKNWYDEEVNKIKSQPSIGDIISKHIKREPDND